jgi:peptidoglycan LD-endopeptidase LytH
VVSATDGVVTRVGEGGLGGRVVWVWNPARGLLLYYAHLDEQLVRTGEPVRRGDILGTVGNTGNARTTPPHLHFGIYHRGIGAIDPYWFIAPKQVTSPPRATASAFPSPAALDQGGPARR